MTDLSKIPTQELLDEFIARAERGETMAPIVHWIANMAALTSIQEFAKVASERALSDDTPEASAQDKQWLLDRVVYALTCPKYEEWVLEFRKKTGEAWDVGQQPSYVRVHE